MTLPVLKVYRVSGGTAGYKDRLTMKWPKQTLWYLIDDGCWTVILLSVSYMLYHILRCHRKFKIDQLLKNVTYILWNTSALQREEWRQEKAHTCSATVISEREVGNGDKSSYGQTNAHLLSKSPLSLCLPFAVFLCSLSHLPLPLLLLHSSCSSTVSLSPSLCACRPV